MKRLIFLIILASAILLFVHTIAQAWGSTGHRIVNRRATRHLPPEMSLFKRDSLVYESLSMAADYRRSGDTDTSLFREEFRHYMNIDAYPNFRNLTRNLNTLIAIYGRSTVQSRGLNPWATKIVFDSLVAQLSRNDPKADTTASDLGHYVADAHQPLHCTRNYDGQYTGNNGIHSRYESSMISLYHSFLIITQDSARYVNDVVNYAFDYILHSQSLVDSILRADNYAKQVSGWNGSGTPPTAYYTALWQRTGNMTKNQFQRATAAIASLWYTAWVNAGLSTSVNEAVNQPPTMFVLHQNYPNPFNSITTIQYAIPEENYVTLKVYNVLGQLVTILVDEVQSAGYKTVNFEGSNLQSGTYFYCLQAGKFVASKKLLLVK